MGAKLLKRIAGSANTYAGDGTTTASLLSREILQRGIHAVEFEKAHPISVKRGIDKALQVVLSILKRSQCLLLSLQNLKTSARSLVIKT